MPDAVAMERGMMTRKPRITWPRFLTAGLLIVAALAIGWIFIVGPNPHAFFRPDPCFDGEGVMVACEG